ncbi:MAG: hypothetical protein NVSMB9_27140 [Isosphaeraceae bacterium]
MAGCMEQINGIASSDATRESHVRRRCGMTGDQTRREGEGVGRIPHFQASTSGMVKFMKLKTNPAPTSARLWALRVSFLAIAGLACSGIGCSGSSTSGDEGTVSIVESKEKAALNPEIAKAAARRGGGMGAPPIKSKKK